MLTTFISPGLVFLYIILGVIILVLLIGVLLSIKIVRQSDAVIIEHLGSYKKTLTHGLNWITPFLDRAIQTVSLKERVCDFKPQPVITKDNVTMQIDTVVYFLVADPKLFVYGVERPINAIDNLTATTLRNLIGELELDQTLTSRDTINTKMRLILDEATDPWGIKITRVELKNILPPREIQEAMEKQMRAERERRESILRAEGDKHSRILVAEGEKEAVILRSEANKAQVIAEAQANAERIRLEYEAQANSIKLINSVNPGSAYITLEGYKALEKVADGKASKLIIPSELTSIASLMSTVTEVVKANRAEDNEVVKTKK